MIVWATDPVFVSTQQPLLFSNSSLKQPWQVSTTLPALSDKQNLLFMLTLIIPLAREEILTPTTVPSWDIGVPLRDGVNIRPFLSSKVIVVPQSSNPVGI